jgi:hypothetical protein
MALLVAACSQSVATPGTPTAPPATSGTASAPASQSAAATARPSPIPQISVPITRIKLPGTAPAAIAVAKSGLWVYSIESGDLSSVNTVTASVEETIHVGGLGSHIVPAADGGLFVGRFDNGGAGASGYLLKVGPAPGSIGDIETGPIGSLAVDEDGYLYALEKADRLLRFNPEATDLVASASVAVDDEHMEVIVDRGAAWVSSDHTPLRRLSLPDLTVTDTLDVGGGIPFVAQREKIWGARPGTLWVLDEDTRQVEREIPLPGVDEILDLDVDAGLNEIWLGVRMTGRVGAVLRLDIASGAITGTYPVSLPASVSMIGPDVLVASYLDNELLRFARE